MLLDTTAPASEKLLDESLVDDPPGPEPKGESADRAEIRKKNRENKQLRDRLRAAELEAESFRAAKKSEEEESQKRKGEFQKLYETEKQEKERIIRELQTERVNRVVGAALTKAGLKTAAMADVLALLPHDRFKVSGSNVEGVDEVIAKFKADKPWFFSDEASVKRFALTAEDFEDAKRIDWKDPWGAADLSGQGLDGYRPVSGKASSVLRMTPELIEDAKRRGLRPQDWLDIQKAREAKKQSRR